MGQISDDVMEGVCCALCGVYFKKANGYPVLCKSCWAEEGPKAAKGMGYQETRIAEA